MTKDAARRELAETARLALAAMAAEERMVSLGSGASVAEAEHVRREAARLHDAAMARFKLMCYRLACHAKEGFGSPR